MGGPTKKGFAIVDADSNELLEIEPVFYSNGDRWKIVNRTDERPGILYAKSLKGIDKKVGTLRPGWTGYKFSAQTSGRNGKLTAAGVTNQAN